MSLSLSICESYNERCVVSRGKRVTALSLFSWLHTILYFSVPLDEKVPEGAEPRFWEEEGFYVGEPPQVSPANLNIMENRIKDGNQVFIITRCILIQNLKGGHL